MKNVLKIFIPKFCKKITVNIFREISESKEKILEEILDDMLKKKSLGNIPRNAAGSLHRDFHIFEGFPADISDGIIGEISKIQF